MRRPKVEELVKTRLLAKANRLASARTQDGSAGGKPIRDASFSRVS